MLLSVAGAALLGSATAAALVAAALLQLLRQAVAVQAAFGHVDWGRLVEEGR